MSIKIEKQKKITELEEAFYVQKSNIKINDVVVRTDRESILLLNSTAIYVNMNNQLPVEPYRWQGQELTIDEFRAAYKYLIEKLADLYKRKYEQHYEIDRLDDIEKVMYFEFNWE